MPPSPLESCSTWHISVMVSSKTPPASSAPSPTSFTFQAREGSRRSEAFSFTTCRAICTRMGLHFRPLGGEEGEISRPGRCTAPLAASCLGPKG